ncbi:MAG: SufE family protein [Pseudomonadota bacterium]
MAQADFEEIVDTFEFLDDWEDRYRHVIDMGKALPPYPDALRVPATKVDGCASQVWLHASDAGGALRFQGDSDAMIVKGLIAVLLALYNGLSPAEAAAVDARTELERLNLTDHLSAQRSNGLRAMVDRIKETAAARL